MLAGLSPTSGPVGGDTLVDVTGTGLTEGSWRQCGFNLTLVNASVASVAGGAAACKCRRPA